MAEFVANNTPLAITRVSPFFANTGYEPRLSFNIKATAPVAQGKEAINY